MTIRELAFEVHYSGRIKRGLTCIYVGGDVDVDAETYDEDKLSFFEIEGIVKKIWIQVKGSSVLLRTR
jgi:hypothetical protein